MTIPNNVIKRAENLLTKIESDLKTIPSNKGNFIVSVAHVIAMADESFDFENFYKKHLPAFYRIEFNSSPTQISPAFANEILKSARNILTEGGKKKVLQIRAMHSTIERLLDNLDYEDFDFKFKWLNKDKRSSIINIYYPDSPSAIKKMIVRLNWSEVSVPSDDLSSYIGYGDIDPDDESEEDSWDDDDDGYDD